MSKEDAIQKAIYRLRLDLVIIEGNFWTEHGITEAALADMAEGIEALLAISAVLFPIVHDDGACSCSEQLHTIHAAYEVAELVGDDDY